jgi:hypothetical protein
MDSCDLKRPSAAHQPADRKVRKGGAEGPDIRQNIRSELWAMKTGPAEWRIKLRARTTMKMTAVDPGLPGTASRIQAADRRTKGQPATADPPALRQRRRPQPRLGNCEFEGGERAADRQAGGASRPRQPCPTTPGRSRRPAMTSHRSNTAMPAPHNRDDISHGDQASGRRDGWHFDGQVCAR